MDAAYTMIIDNDKDEIENLMMRFFVNYRMTCMKVYTCLSATHRSNSCAIVLKLRRTTNPCPYQSIGIEEDLFL